MRTKKFALQLNLQEKQNYSITHKQTNTQNKHAFHYNYVCILKNENLNIKANTQNFEIQSRNHKEEMGHGTSIIVLMFVNQKVT